MALERVPAATQILVKASNNLERQDFRGLIIQCLSAPLSDDSRQMVVDGLLDSGVPQEDLPGEILEQPATEDPSQTEKETGDKDTDDKETEKDTDKQEAKLPPCFTWRVEPTLEFDDIQPINEIGSRVVKDGKYGIID